MRCMTYVTCIPRSLRAAGTASPSDTDAYARPARAFELVSARSVRCSHASAPALARHLIGVAPDGLCLFGPFPPQTGPGQDASLIATAAIRTLTHFLFLFYSTIIPLPPPDQGLTSGASSGSSKDAAGRHIRHRVGEGGVWRCGAEWAFRKQARRRVTRHSASRAPETASMRGFSAVPSLATARRITSRLAALAMHDRFALAVRRGARMPRRRSCAMGRSGRQIRTACGRACGNFATCSNNR